MAEKRKDSNINTVSIKGYLKENTLEQVTSSTGDQVIRGALLVATDALNAHKIQFYISETKFNGEHSADFDRMQELLPAKTVSMASFLKDASAADFAMATNAATKVWVMAHFDEYATRNGERMTSLVTLRGDRAGLATADKGPFVPKAEFSATIYINKMEPEQDEAGGATGRIKIEGLLPRYKGLLNVIDFIAVADNNVAEVARTYWHVGDTVRIDGDLVSLALRKKIEGAENSSFGRPRAPQYETTFIRERRIMGGPSKEPIRGDGALTKDMVKTGLALREAKMEQNGSRAQQNASRGSSASVRPVAPSTPSYPTGTGFPGEDVDF